MASDMNDPILDREWGNYIVECKIGEGGMGAVYRLVHKTLPNTYAALKVLNARGAAVASAKERFDQEAKVAASIGKDRVARVLDQGEFSDGIAFIVMEYIQGQSLADQLEQTGPMRVLTAFQIAYRIADSLAIAHNKKIVHRDIKPSNIMLTRTRERELSVTILDWGIARARGEFQVAQTMTSAIAGTLGYMAPEVVRRGSVVDGRADVFSLGVVLYKMLTGMLPFPALTSEDQIPAFIASRPPPIGQNRPPALDHVPRWLERIVLRAVAPMPDDRLTIDEFREELGKAISRLRVSPENDALDQESAGPAAAAVRRSVSTSGVAPIEDDATKLLQPATASSRRQGTTNVFPERLTKISTLGRYRALVAASLAVAIIGGSILLIRSCGHAPLRGAAPVDLGMLRNLAIRTAAPPDLADKKPVDLADHKPPNELSKPTAIPAKQPVTVRPSSGGNVKLPRTNPPAPKSKCFRNATGAIVCP